MRTSIGLILMCIAGYLGFQDEIINYHWSLWLIGILILLIGSYNAFIGLLDFSNMSDNKKT